jgi:arabinofuranosyltransferase
LKLVELAFAEDGYDGDGPALAESPLSRLHRAVQLAVLLAPAVIILALGWHRRWMNEDAFINLRIVDQIFAGHGPVFNAGERVETYTSPLWLGVLVVARGTLGQLMEVEWATVVVSLASAVSAFVVGGLAARRLHDRDEWAIPLGLFVLAAIPVVWDFATSGLEVGITWLWLAGCWWLLVRAAKRTEPATGAGPWVALVVLGLGPVIRPDLGLVTVCVVAAWIVLSPGSIGRIVGDVAVAFAIPIAYQVFRMGYFASLVPSTALAKDAGGLHLHQGVRYGADLMNSYWLWIPLACLAIVIGRNVMREGRRVGIATAALVIGGLLHAAYFVAIGGDYMHGRLLLPALFAIALPASIGLRTVTVWAGALVGIVAVWFVVCAATLRFDQPKATLFTVAPISDWRLIGGARVMPREIPNENFITGKQIHALYERDGRGFLPIAKFTPVPGKDPKRLAVALGSIGIPAYDAGRDVFIVDMAGLAEPLSARTSTVAGRAAGHRKGVDEAWYYARFAADGQAPPGGAARVAAAKRALRCAPVADLLHAIDEPLTPGRFLGNLWHSPTYTTLHIPADPIEAERDLCPARKR